jgi:hypothetical protein
MNPAHDTKNPPGCHYEKPLANQIEEYKTTLLYQRGYKDGFEVGKKAVLAIPEALINSEYTR